MERTPRVPRVAPPCRPPRAFALLFCLGAGLWFPGVTAAQDQLRVAVVDVARVFGGYYKTKEIEKTLAEAREAAGQQLAARLEDHHRLLEETARIDKDLENPALDPSARVDRRKKRGDKAQETHAQEQETRELKASRDRDLQELTSRLRNQITEDILTVVRARVETSHYDLVLNKSAPGTRGNTEVLYANPSMDITDDVITTLNQSHEAVSGAKPAATPQP